MSKMGCICGHSIPDQTDELPYKARILVDEDTQTPRDLLTRAIIDLLEARRQGKEAERDYLTRFRAAFYSSETVESAADWIDHVVDQGDLAKVLDELLFAFWNRYDRALYQCERCERCGRIYLPDPDPKKRNHYVSYLPEDGQRGVLASWFHHREEAEVDFPLHLFDGLLP